MIKETLKGAISNLSKKYKIGAKEIRIKISKNGGNLVYDIMNKKDIVDTVTLAQALNLNAIQAFMVGNKLEHIFQKISNVNSVSQDSMNVRIYTIEDDCSPSFYLFDDKNAIRELKYEEIAD